MRDLGTRASCLHIAAWAFVVLAIPTRTLSAAEWTSFTGQGCSLEHPVGWQVEPDASQGTIVVHGSNGEQMTVWPLFVRTELTSELARLMIVPLAKRVEPTIAWSEATNLAGPGVKLGGRDGAGNSAVASLSWVATKQGSAAIFNCVAAATASFDESARSFAEILASLRLCGPRVALPSSDFEPQPWRDPKEDAFEVEIPKGWQVHGGLARFGAADTRPAIEVRSPDGRLRVYLGDTNTPTFIVPSATLEGAGYVEGSWYAPPLGMRMQVRRSMSGAQFARWIATTSVAREMTNLRFNAVRNRPDIDRVLAGILRRAGLPDVDQQIKAGEGDYTCRDKEGAFVGYTFAATLEKPLARGHGDQWSVRQSFGYLSPVEEALTAEMVLRHMVGSFRFNPAWVLKQRHLDVNFAETSAQIAVRLADTIRETVENRAETLARESRLRETENVVVDITDATDPATGLPLRAESGAGYYWIDPRGNIVGTQSYSLPNIDARELVRQLR